MMAKKSRVYWRNQGGVRRAYIDLRDLGGGREALKAPGEKRGTTDPDIAIELAARRVKELEGQTRRKVIMGVERVGGSQEVRGGASAPEGENRKNHRTLVERYGIPAPGGHRVLR